MNTLLHEPAVIVQRVIIALGLGTLPSAAGAWPVWAETEPDRPDNGITVQETVGQDDMRGMLDGTTEGTYGFQIRIRGNDRAAARLKADAIATTIAARSTCYFDKPACWVSLDSSSYVLQMFVRIGNPLPIGADVPGGKRQLVTINCEARIIQQA